MKTKLFLGIVAAVMLGVWLRLPAQNLKQNTISKKEANRITLKVPQIYWSLSCPSEQMSGKPHNDPSEVKDITFTGTDGSKWRAVKWERMKPLDPN